MSLATATISDLRKQLTAGEITAVDIVDALAAKISAQDGEIGAYLATNLDDARAQAAAADLSKPLGGIPIALKDNINVLGEQCTCGSKFLSKGYTAPYDAHVTGLLRESGAVFFGRTNLDEFAMGSATENSALQVTRNPRDLSRIPGGSSGGSAAAVAADLAIAALGSDTGGSIRQPASHCGIVGLKPSYGRVSRYGLVAFASSLDQIGPMTKSVEDAALLLQAIAGPDHRDSTCLNLPVPDYSADLHKGVAGMKLGIPKEYFGEGIDPEVRARVEASVKRLEAAGAEIVEISLPHTEHAVATYYIIAPAEASSNLSRFDGIRYGQRAAAPADLLDLYKRSREEGFGPEVKRRIILGTYVLSSGYYDAYYTRAQKVRTLIRRDFENAFQQVDAILTPVAPAPARRLALAKEVDDAFPGNPVSPEAAAFSGAVPDPLHEYLSDIFTLGPNLAGLCAISVPAGTVTSDTGTELPVGLQILAPHMAESTLLRVAKAAEL